jgi:hypothetical protein
MLKKIETALYLLGDADIPIYNFHFFPISVNLVLENCRICIRALGWSRRYQVPSVVFQTPK